jgi:hypothetical protein
MARSDARNKVDLDDAPSAERAFVPIGVDSPERALAEELMARAKQEGISGPWLGELAQRDHPQGGPHRRWTRLLGAPSGPARHVLADRRAQALPAPGPLREP